MTSARFWSLVYVVVVVVTLAQQLGIRAAGMAIVGFCAGYMVRGKS